MEKRLPRKPPEPSPYPERADHAAETGEAAQLKEDYMKEFQQAWKDVMEMTKSGTFTAPKRRSGLVVAVSPLVSEIVILSRCRHSKALHEQKYPQWRTLALWSIESTPAPFLSLFVPLVPFCYNG